MAEFDIVCQDCGEHFTAVSKLARYCRVCRNKRNNESKKRSLINRALKDRYLMPEKPKQPELPKMPKKEPAKKPQYSFKPAACPQDCVYLQLFGGKRQLCGYLLTTDEVRGCDPGPGCKRYVSMKSGPKHRRAKWDVDRGKQMWLEGRTDLEIAKELHVRSRAVKAYRLRVWEKENNHDRA